MATMLVIILVLIVAGLMENMLHLRRLRKIPIRIHVNGTRGKSATTRLIAAGLRACGLRVLAKTTGTAPRLILEDGSERPIRRMGKPNIIEQLRFVTTASRHQAEVLVVECMALHPENQLISEQRLIGSTIGVITNVRDDHLDVMGPSLADAARVLALTIPRSGRLVTAERRFLGVFQERALMLHTELHSVDETEIPLEVLKGFPYIAFKENIACALKVCEIIGVDREKALKGMTIAQTDPGTTRILWMEISGNLYSLIDAFAANDPASNMLIWQRFFRGDRCIQPEFQSLMTNMRLTVPSAATCDADIDTVQQSKCEIRIKKPIIAVMNNRADRSLRTAALAKMLARDVRPDYTVLIGQAGALARRQLVRAGLNESRVLDMTGRYRPEEVMQRIDTLIAGDALLLGLGNTKGMGQRMVEYFYRLGDACSDCQRLSEREVDGKGGLP